MKVFVTGASGYVGVRVVERLLARGHQVTGLVRSDAGAARLESMGALPLPGDLGEIDRLVTAARGAEATLHLGFTHDGDFGRAVEADHQVHLALAQGLAGSGRTLIVSNGTGGFGDTGHSLADETTPVDLDFPLAARNRAENLVTAATDLRGIAIRLPLLVYGHGGSVFLPMLLGSARRRNVAAYVGDGRNQMSTAHVDDVADLYVQALERGRPQQVYIASSGVTVSFADIARAIADNVGPGCRVASVSPDEAAQIWNPVWAVLLSLTNRVSGDKARRELGWSPKSSPGLLDDVARGSYLAGAAAPA